MNAKLREQIFDQMATLAQRQEERVQKRKEFLKKSLSTELPVVQRFRREGSGIRIPMILSRTSDLQRELQAESSKGRSRGKSFAEWCEKRRQEWKIPPVKESEVA